MTLLQMVLLINNRYIYLNVIQSSVSYPNQNYHKSELKVNISYEKLLYFYLIDIYFSLIQQF